MQTELYGSQAFMDIFPSDNVTLNTVIDITPLASRTITIGELMNTAGGSPLCYIYL